MLIMDASKTISISVKKSISLEKYAFPDTGRFSEPIRYANSFTVKINE